MKKIQSLFIITFLLVLSCQRGPLDVNTSGIDLEINILRLEKDLFESDREDLKATIQVVSEKYGEFLSVGIPINFNVPKQPATVISGLKLGDHVLVRRTDFAGTSGDVEIAIDNKKINVKAVPKSCQIISIR